MPELPDVEIFRKYAAKALNKKIKEISVKEKKLVKVSESTLRKHMLGKRFTSTSRHGKYLFLKISGGSVLVLHFGMTGELAYCKKKDREKSKGSKEDRKDKDREKGKEMGEHKPR
ncbi:hypothetical protein GF351_05960, partial [Candidatus Woesearchaeota archaeon]|nr:hypothetical protein [Candidatus Woesearchaeota archaeon]